MNDKAIEIAEQVTNPVMIVADGLRPNTTKSLIKEIADLIRPHLKQEWISVKDRSPEEFDPCIVCDINGVSGDEREPFIAHMECGIWLEINPFNWGEHVRVTPTHWQPLPEAPHE